MKQYFIIIIMLCFTFISYGQMTFKSIIEYNYKLSDKQWEAKLTPQQFQVLRRRGTEQSFTGEYWDNKKQGIYKCSGCNHNLFTSETKFKSGTGWPSFYTFIKNGVEIGKDNDIGYTRNEVHCANCGGHLGHVFKDGPTQTGLRYCINSVSLKFNEE